MSSLKEKASKKTITNYLQRRVEIKHDDDKPSLRKETIINRLQERVHAGINVHTGIKLILDNKRLKNINSKLRKENRKLHNKILKEGRKLHDRISILEQEKRNLIVELSNLKDGQNTDSDSDWVKDFNTKKTSLIF